VADDGSNRAFSSGGASRQLREALEKLKSASALISISIKAEVAGLNDQDVLERLYCAKGGVTCAIEETERHFCG
jgi:hypothetical protein